MRIAVLMGGTSSEREISLSTGRMIAAALDSTKYEVLAIDTQDLLSLQQDGDLPIPPPATSEAALVSQQLERETSRAVATGERAVARAEKKADRPDFVFIALHGRGGEDGAVQGLLEVLGLPYTGSGILASALAMDKRMTKRLFRGEGIPVAEEILLRRGDLMLIENLAARIEADLGGFPVFVKPNAEGSTVGGTLVLEAGSLVAAIEQAFRFDSLILIERYLRGMEVTVGVLGNAGDTLEALPIVEIVPKSEFYDFESKYADGGSEHIIPARLSGEMTNQIQALARRCHEALGCRCMSRTDFIVTADGPFVLEVNTIPGMTPTSLLPQAAAVAGISFPELLDRIIAYASRA